MIERDWEGSPAVVIASGPSLLPADVDYCRGKARVIVVNDCWRLAPWADALYAADLLWWNHHQGVPEFSGEKWTNSVSGDAGPAYGVRVVTMDSSQPGFSFNPERLHRVGGNGGGQAVNLALLRGANPILLLGFDMQATGGRKHWFGNHPKPMDRTQEFGKWVRDLDAACAGAVALGVEIINCSRETALRQYPRAALADCLPAAARQAALSA